MVRGGVAISKADGGGVGHRGIEDDEESFTGEVLIVSGGVSSTGAGGNGVDVGGAGPEVVVVLATIAAMRVPGVHEMTDGRSCAIDDAISSRSLSEVLRRILVEGVPPCRSRGCL